MAKEKGKQKKQTEN